MDTFRHDVRVVTGAEPVTDFFQASERMGRVVDDITEIREFLLRNNESGPSDPLVAELAECLAILAGARR